jgi:hypothetical protein
MPFEDPLPKTSLEYVRQSLIVHFRVDYPASFFQLLITKSPFAKWSVGINALGYFIMFYKGIVSKTLN